MDQDQKPNSNQQPNYDFILNQGQPGKKPGEPTSQKTGFKLSKPILIGAVIVLILLVVLVVVVLVTSSNQRSQSGSSQVIDDYLLAVKDDDLSKAQSLLTDELKQLEGDWIEKSFKVLNLDTCKQTSSESVPQIASVFKYDCKTVIDSDISYEFEVVSVDGVYKISDVRPGS